MQPSCYLLGHKSEGWVRHQKQCAELFKNRPPYLRGVPASQLGTPRIHVGVAAPLFFNNNTRLRSAGGAFAGQMLDRSLSLKACWPAWLTGPSVRGESCDLCETGGHISTRGEQQ